MKYGKNYGTIDKTMILFRKQWTLNYYRKHYGTVGKKNYGTIINYS